jgi:hypothetical protein
MGCLQPPLGDVATRAHYPEANTFCHFVKLVNLMSAATGAIDNLVVAKLTAALAVRQSWSRLQMSPPPERTAVANILEKQGKQRGVVYMLYTLTLCRKGSPFEVQLQVDTARG